MPADPIRPDFQYSPWTGLAYVFNLIVGTGALTLPAAFATAGWALSLAIVLILAFMSFVTVTFMVEAMSVANALIKTKVHERQVDRRNRAAFNHRERDPLIPHDVYDRPDESFNASTVSVYEIERSVEMGSMASMYFGQVGVSIFYICIAVYLYGDLAIYIAAVAKSLRDVICTYVPDTNHNSSMILNETSIVFTPAEDYDLCWAGVESINRLGAYRLSTIAFMVVLGPFVFFNVSKTKYLQLLTTFMRWLAFGIMISLAVTLIASGQGTGRPVLVNVRGIPNLFGVCVYSFMCHHSLPSLVAPISNKGRLLKMFFLDYIIITLFYLLLAFTGIFAFKDLQDLYTMNFELDRSSGISPTVFKAIISYFLLLFPVFTLSTNFPIIAITLRNNLRALFQVQDPNTNPHLSVTQSSFTKFFSQVLCPILAIFPPFLVAIFVENVQLLVGITGSYAGAGIQYFIPVFLVHCARKHTFTFADVSGDFNQNISPFRHVAWLWFVSLWAGVSIAFVTVHHFLSAHFSF